MKTERLQRSQRKGGQKLLRNYFLLEQIDLLSSVRGVGCDGGPISCRDQLASCDPRNADRWDILVRQIFGHIWRVDSAQPDILQSQGEFVVSLVGGI